ncbi:hypothetical protein TRIUR3_07643 [Triticum urartu]|uniref:Uncharacterized protein n=1 Tax=Triticum urartu TaxID=4572 RepID=M8A748_TRIUA|nr:hypothetical protein TRIUR3_07643 [Triticum urartu]
MAEISDAPAVTSGELAAVLRAMDEKYRALFDAISKQASSSKSEAEIKEEIHPLQMPHVKLEGPENYVSWAELINTCPHGNINIVHAKFISNLPVEAIGRKVGVLVYLSSI